jgi:xanthine phosphoribosyltransferase
MDKQKITSGQIKSKLENSPELIRKLNKFEKIMVVTRGGLGVAAILSQFLESRNYNTINISSYKKNKTRSDLEVHKLEPSDEELLILEDIVDSGATLELLRENFTNSKVFSLHYKPESASAKPDFYLWETDAWIVYPWELS